MLLSTLGALALPPGFTPRIVDGDAATPYSIPYQVSIQHGGGHHCGGSLISPGCV